MTTTVFEIPLDPNAQNFDITLGGVDYYMRLLWNAYSAAWTLDIADTNNVDLVCGIPLVPGVDLLSQYGHLGFTGGLMCLNESGIGSPTYEGLGITGHLYFVTTS